MNKYTLLAYQSVVTSAIKKAQAQKEWLDRIGMTQQEAIKRIVVDYFHSIKCEFKEDFFNEAIKEVN